MSKQGQDMKVSIGTLQKMKADGQKIAMVTCYDAAFANLISQTEMDVVLVGDSMGNVILGYENTIPVSMDVMTHHVAAVNRGLKGPMLVADMPFMSYRVSQEQAIANAARLVQEGGAHAVKVEGGLEILPQVESITKTGIPVMGHLGLTPQKIHALGGYKVQGRGDAATSIVEAAKALEGAGCFSIVLELLPAELAQDITQALTIPTIGIGAGAGTDGQVLVLHDLLGFNEDFCPKFLKKYAELGRATREALDTYVTEVKASEYPTEEYSFKS